MTRPTRRKPRMKPTKAWALVNKTTNQIRFIFELWVLRRGVFPPSTYRVARIYITELPKRRRK